VDPFACLLSQAFQTDLLDETDEDAASLAMTQTAFVDRLLMDAVSRRLRQVLLWRSGTDTRAFRLQLPPQVRFIEVDDVHVHEVKSKILEEANARPRCALKRVGSEELSGHLLDSKKPSFLVLDNLSLEDDGVHVESLSKTAAEGSRIVVQLRNLEGVESSAWLELLQRCGWARGEQVPEMALRQMFQERLPSAGGGAVLVAEMGPLQMPGRPAAPGAKRKDGAPMSSYGWRGD